MVLELLSELEQIVSDAVSVLLLHNSRLLLDGEQIVPYHLEDSLDHHNRLLLELTHPRSVHAVLRLAGRHLSQQILVFFLEK